MRPAKPVDPNAVSRRHPRIPVRMDVSVRSLVPRGDDTVRDISEGGIGVDTPRPLEQDLLVSMRLSLPTAKGPLDVLGRIVWTESGAMGIRFVDPDPALFLAVSQLRHAVTREPSRRGHGRPE